MTKHHQNLGRWGEDRAVEYLCRKGFTIIARNIVRDRKEVDIVACKSGVWHFIEVKTRSSQYFGFPEDSVNRQKLDHIKTVALLYLEERQQEETPVCYDIIAIEQRQYQVLNITFIEDVF